MIATTQIPGLGTNPKIRAFLQYPRGWRYGEGRPPRPETIGTAIEINNNAARQGLETDAFLGTEGEVRVTVYHGLEYLQFTIEDDDGLIEYVRELGDEEVVRQPEISLADALNILENFRLELCHSSALSTAPTTIPIEDISKTSHSKLPDAEQVFQWLRRTVQSKETLRFVST